MLHPLSVEASSGERSQHYLEVMTRIEGLLDDETDGVAAMSTVAAELFGAFAYIHWAGFYRRLEPELLAVGPYQGGHGCTRIPFSRGVCGAAARLGQTQLVDDVHAFEDHIACSSQTQSELVVPVFNGAGEVVAVIDLDSDAPAAFSVVDQVAVEQIARLMGERFVLDGALQGSDR